MILTGTVHGQIISVRLSIFLAASCRYWLYGHMIYGLNSYMVNNHSYARGPLLSNLSNLWSYQLIGQLLSGPIADHISDIFSKTFVLIENTVIIQSHQTTEHSSIKFLPFSVSFFSPRLQGKKKLIS